MELMLKNNIAERLENANMTTRDLMGLIDVSYPKMKSIIDGNDLKVSDALKIAAVFCCEVQDIWQQVFSMKTEQVVTEKQVLSFSAPESVFTE